MTSLYNVLKPIQEIANDFNGEITLKNSQRQYFFVNDNWLSMTGLERKDVIGKIDAEIFLPPASMQIMMEDKKAIENKLPAEYIGKHFISNNSLIRVVMKWAVTYDSGDLFCICTLSVKPQNKNLLYDARARAEELFEKVF